MLAAPRGPCGCRLVLRLLALPPGHQRGSHSGKRLPCGVDDIHVHGGQLVGLFVLQNALQRSFCFFDFSTGPAVQRLAGLAAQRGVGPVFRLMGRTVKNALRKRKESAR